jgi:hypothetical protein
LAVDESDPNPAMTVRGELGICEPVVAALCGCVQPSHGYLPELSLLVDVHICSPWSTFVGR